MSEETLKKIFSKNLCYYMSKNDTKPNDIARICNVTKASVSNWVNGKKIPRMDKIEVLANYFNIAKSDLIELHHKARTNKTDTAAVNLTDNEKKIVSNYRKLNDLGQSKADEYITDLSENPKYTDSDRKANLANIFDDIAKELSRTTGKNAAHTKQD